MCGMCGMCDGDCVSHLQWDRRRMVESNMQNMALEFAIRKQKKGGQHDYDY